MEVMKMSDVTEKAYDRMKREGCYLEKYMVSDTNNNAEEWLYIIHPRKKAGANVAGQG